MDTEIQGKLGHILYRDESTRYTVARFRLYELNEKTITVTGYLPEFPKDTLIALEGDYVEHPKFGLQFSIRSFRKILPTEPDSIITFLSSPLFVGIGKKFAQAIIEHLGDHALERLKEDPDLLDEVKGSNPKKKLAIIDGLVLAGEDEEALKFFTTHGIGIRNILRLEKVYGKKAYSLVKENPYRMCEEVDGIGFKTADKLALSMGFEYDDPRRLKAALSALCLELCMSSGDAYVLQDNLALSFTKNFTEIDYETVLESCLIERKLIQEEDRIYVPSQYFEEKNVANFLRDYPFSALAQVPEDQLLNAIQHHQDQLGIHYDEKQIDAILQFFNEPISILTGGPGTGKTTVVGAMIEVFKQVYPAYQLACIAPTGRAAKRLTEINSVQAYTIHSLLKWDLETNTFGKNEQDPLEIDCLIIDEFSMVDTYLFSSLLKASFKVKKILLVGDQDQIPSVGPGDLLSNLLESQKIPSLSLQTIYRQQDGSDVIGLAHQIRQENIDFKAFNKDIIWVSGPVIDLKQQLMSLVQSALDKGYSLYDIQVLSPMYSGIMGIDNLNHALQKLLNPQEDFKRELKIGSIIFRENDKILQLKNQPTDDVYNGDIGLLIEIIYAKESDDKQNHLIVDFDGRIVEYGAENFQNISLAYCISIHKSQGSEYPIVFIPILSEHKNMLRKRLLYTAITRASKALILLGSSTLFIESAKAQKERKRETTLLKRLNEC